MDAFALRRAVVTAAWSLVGLLGVLLLFGWSRRQRMSEARLRGLLDALARRQADAALALGARVRVLESLAAAQEPACWPFAAIDAEDATT